MGRVYHWRGSGEGKRFGNPRTRPRRTKAALGTPKGPGSGGGVRLLRKRKAQIGNLGKGLYRETKQLKVKRIDNFRLKIGGRIFFNSEEEIQHRRLLGKQQGGGVWQSVRAIGEGKFSSH